MRFKLDISCDSDSAMKRLAAMQIRSRTLQPVFEYARIQLRNANAANFATGGLPSGGWEPRREPKPWPLMVRTGKLMASLTSLFGPPNNVSGTSAEFGTRVEYAKFHQYGTNKMPARKIVFEPAGFARDIGSKAAAFVANGLEP